MSIPASARRHRPPDMDSDDTTRRVNYRPTALPRSHHRNMSPYRSAGARWLSEDEGGDTARKVNRLSDDDGRGKHFATSIGRSAQATRHDTHGRAEASHTQDQSSPSSASHSNRNKSSSRTDATAGSAGNGRSRMPSAGLLAAKAQWQAMETTGRRRLRRANSQEAAPEPSMAQQEHAEVDPGTTISGHPLASETGVPMPSIQDIAPIRRPSGGVATFIAATTHDAGPSTSRPPSTVATDTATASNPRAHVPDYEVGRGGDGVGGNGLPAGEPSIDVQERQATAEFKRKVLPELKSILTWYVAIPSLQS